MDHQVKRKPRRRGQVIPLGSGSFKLRIPLGRDGTGKRKYHTETLHNLTPTKAEKRATEILAQVDAGTFFEPSSTRVKDYLEAEWLPQKRREGVRSNTLKGYDRVVRCHLVPFIGALPLSHIKPKHIQDLYNAWQDRQLAGTTMAFSRTVLGMAMKQAVVWGYIKQNPATGISAPSSKNKRKREGRAFSVEEAVRFLEVAGRDLVDLIYVFQLVTGLRPEEIAGLRWSDVEIIKQRDHRSDTVVERGIAHVRQVALQVKGIAWEFLDPKTDKGRRDVYFPAHIYHQLLLHREAQEAARRIAGKSWRDHNLVFPAKDGTPLRQGGRYRHRFHKLLKNAGLMNARFTPYSLRYSFATLALLAGELDKTVSDQMGHAKIDFTKDVYVKVLPEMQQSMSDKFEKLLFSVTGNQAAHLEAGDIM